MPEVNPTLPPNTSNVIDPGGSLTTLPVMPNQSDQQANMDRSSSIIDHLKFAVPGMVAASVDTVGRSVGLLNENDTQQFVSNVDKNFGDYYTNHKEGLHLAGDLATFLLPGTMGAKAVQSGSWLFRAVQAERVPLLQKLFTSAADVTDLTRPVYSYDLAKASKGAIDFVSSDPVRAKLVTDAYKSGLTDSVKRYIGSEAAIYATMNQSETFYPSDAGIIDTVLMHSVGLAIGGGIEAAFIRSNIKRSLTREDVTSAVATAINRLDLPDTIGVRGERDFPAFLASVSASNQRTLAKTSTDSDITTYAKRYEGLWNDQLKHNIEQIYKDGEPGVVSPNRTNEGGVQTILAAAKADPTIPKGITALQGMPDDPKALSFALGKADEVSEDLFKKALKLEKDDPIKNADEAASLRKEALRKKGITPVVIDANGDVTQPQNVKILYQNKTNPETIRTLPKSTLEDQKFVLDTVDPTTRERSVLALSENLLPIYPSGKSWIDLTRYQQSAMYALGQKLIDKYTPGKPFLEKIILKNDTEPFVLDLARSIVRKNPEAATDFKLPDGIGTAQFDKWAEHTSLKNKFDQYQTMMKRFNTEGNAAFIGPPNLNQSASYVRTISIDGIQNRTLDDIRYALNFPASRFGEDHPAFQVFRSLAMQGDTKLDEALGSIDHFQGLMHEERAKLGSSGTLPWLEEMRSGAIETMGNNLAHPVDKAGNFMKSQIAWIKPAAWDMTKDSIDTYALAKRTEFLDKFSVAPPLISSIAQQMIGRPFFQAAQHAELLAEGQQYGKGIASYQNMATRNIDTFTAADMVSSIMENTARQNMKTLFTQYDGAFLKLRSDQASMFQMAQFVQARRYGFELTAEPSSGPNNGMRFILKTAGGGDTGEEAAHTSRNLNAYTKAFGEDFTPPDAGSGPHYLPDIAATVKNGSPVPLELNETAFNAVRAIRDMSSNLYESANFFRDLYGRGKLNFQEWHVPPQNLSNQFVKYIVVPTEAGDQPAKSIITGKSAAELERKMKTQPVQDLLGKEGAYVVDQNDMRRYFDLHDEAFFNLVDYSDGLSQTGRSTGSAVAPVLEYGNQVLNDVISGVEKQITASSRRTIASLFQDQINYARMADRGSEVAASSPKGVTKNSIWNMYVNRLLGVSDSKIRDILNAEVPLLDEKLSQLAETVRNVMPKASATVTKSQVSEFTELKKALGDRLPFDSAAEFAQNTFKVGTPKTLAELSGKLNAVTANVVLRILETGNGAISLFGNLVSLPLVMNNLKRMPYDTDVSWRARTGFFGTDLGADTDFSLPNPVRMVAKSMTFLTSKEGQNMLDEAQKFGYIRPVMAEGYKVMHRPFEGPVSRSMNKVIDALSIPSDRGEWLSRAWAYSAGYNIAKFQGMENKYDMHAFSNLFADNAIANYRPSNKPGIFQGAIGAPLGLFQTYMWNYYGRMFQYIENKDWRALTANYALQGSLFGMQSVPGWEQLNQLYTHAYSGEKDIVDSLDQKYGQQMTDMMLHGTISNIPRLFGRDGISLYSRADVNLTKVPAFISPENAPIFNIAGNTFNLIGALLGQFRQGGAFSSERTMEAISTYSINRPISRILELASGVSVDQRGSVLNEDTRTAMSGVSRVMGMRPLIEQKNIETNARIAMTEAYQQSIHDRIDTSIRALFRGNPSEEQLNNGISKLIMDHLNAGGSPYSVATFIRDAALASYVTKQDRKFLSLINNPGRLNDVLRLTGNMTSYGG